jgi:hypothetical protein
MTDTKYIALCAICGEALDTRQAVQIETGFRHLCCGDGVLFQIENTEEGTAVCIFDRAVIDSAKPFGVRFWDTDAQATIAVFFCSTLALAQQTVSDVTKRPGGELRTV